MLVNIFGLGHVGSLCMACLAQDGHTVRGVDVNPEKVRRLNEGAATVIEPGLDALLKPSWAAGRVSAVLDGEAGLGEAEASLICVGTPAGADGALERANVFRVAERIGASLRDAEEFHTVIVRSTVPPGTNAALTEMLAALSGKTAGSDFAVVSNPEFIREGSAVKDYYHPPFSVVGTDSDRAFSAVQALYEEVEGPLLRCAPAEAEMLKMVCNSFHALKVSFANEIGNVCKAAGVDAHALMDLFCKDTHLNLSPYYLRPGFSYGGSCLSKDLGALCTLARTAGVTAPVLEHIEVSNEAQKTRLLDMIARRAVDTVGLLGLSFKRGTDDLRNSPMVDVAAALIARGVAVRIHDADLRVERLLGANLAYAEAHLPGLAGLLCDDPREVLRACGLLVIGKHDPAYRELLDEFPAMPVIDLVRIAGDTAKLPEHYEGICW